MSFTPFLTILVLGSLFCILIKINKIKKDERGIAIKPIRYKEKKPLSIGVTITIVIILLFVTSSGCTGGDTNKLTAADPQIKIVHPEQKVNWQENIGGTAQNIPDNKELWILVYSKEKQQYYPIHEAEIKYHEWTTPVNIGSKGDDDKEFDIIAVLADKGAQDRFNASINATNESNDGIYSQGIYSIPEGAKEYARITVKRKGWSIFGH